MARMSDESITDLLERLSSGRVDAAWREFLARYSPLIMHVVRRRVADRERADECFVQVCAALSDDGFRKLSSFRPDGPARFRTWLMAVVSNLSTDWLRKERGRARPIRKITVLPDLDQEVYRCIYVRGMSRGQCVETLAPRFPGLTEAAVALVNARLFALLTPQQRWLLRVRNHSAHWVDGSAEREDDDLASQVASPDPGPDELAAQQTDRARLQEALSKLPADLRLLLRLRYEQELTLAEVARLTGQPDLFRANRRIHSALEALAQLMGGRESRACRKS